MIKEACLSSFLLLSLLFLILLFVFIPNYGHTEEDLPCVPKSFGHSSFVCVCNAHYCDTISRPTLPPKDQYLIYTSDKAHARLDKAQGYFAGWQEAKGAAYTLDRSTRYQTMMGWGAAFTDSAAYNILSLTEPTRDKLLRSYFSPDGLEYNFGRLNMGGCDFSWRKYSHAETPGDVTLEGFKLQPEDTDYKIPVVKMAQEMSEKPLKLIASPWSAPPWMKTNDDYIGFGQLKEEMYQPWANYFIRFLDDYVKQNVTFWGLTAQNEPINGFVPGFFFNCMGWTADQQRKWIAGNLGPTLEKHGYSDLVLMFMDDQRLNLPNWADVVLEDPEAAKYVQGIAIHWYMDQFITPDVLTMTHERHPDYFMLGTEACEGDKPLVTEVIPGSWERLEAYAHDIIVDVNHWMTGWVDWNLALDLTGGPNWAKNNVDAAILVSQEQDEFYKNPMFYAMGHFSKFVLEGAVRIGMTKDNTKIGDKIEGTAFTNPDNSTAIVLLSKSDVEELVTIRDSERGTLALSLPPRSLHTIVFQ